MRLKLTDEELRAAPVQICGTVTCSGGSSGGLTDAQLRANPLSVTGPFYPITQPVSGTVSVSGTVPVSGAFYQATQPVSIAATVAVSGPITDAQLRAAAVPVSGAFYPATQPVSGTVSISGSVAVTGSFFQATQPVSIASMPSTPVTGTFFQATQPVSIAAPLQRATDTARSIVNAATAIAGVTAVTSEALLNLNVSRNGAATAQVTSISVTSGKKLRILGITAGAISTAAAVISARVSLRMNPSGAATATSPIIAILPLSQQAAALAQAGDSQSIMFPEAIEISGTMQVGLSQAASAATGTIWASLIAYEY